MLLTVGFEEAVIIVIVGIVIYVGRGVIGKIINGLLIVISIILVIVGCYFILKAFGI